MSPRDRLIEILKRIDDGKFPSLDNQADAIFAALASSGDHAELARLAEAATPGTWAVCPSSSWVVGAEGGGAVCVMQEPFLDRTADANVANAAFIAAANPAAVLALLAENAALRARPEPALINDAALVEQVSRNRALLTRAAEAERKLAEADQVIRDIAETPYTGADWPRSRAATYVASKEAERG